VRLELTRHHGWGNDFLVVDLEDRADVPPTDWASVARGICRRDHPSGGADGLLLLGRDGPGRLTMTLHNSDGTVAEISGNGIRCLVQAALRRDRAGAGAAYTVLTGAGPRHVEVLSGDADSDTIVASVEMGPVAQCPEPAGWDRLGCDPARPVHHVSVGNPHSVVGVESVRDVDLAVLGALVANVNLEIIEPGPEPDAVTMRVHERGVGLTRACGSGACAAAHAAISWGLVPRSGGEVRVHMDGGTATVRFDGDDAVLVGPSVALGVLTVDL
jgi:diaminopimelate epimerase